MKKVNYLLGLVLVVLLCADGFVVGQGMTFYPAITSDEQSALLTGAVQTNDTRNVALGGNLSVDTNTLFIDATTNRVGILTTTPAYTLDVGGQARFSGGIRPNGSMAWDSVGTYNMNQWDGSTARSFFTWNTLVPTNCVTFPYGVVSIASNLTVNGTINQRGQRPDQSRHGLFANEPDVLDGLGCLLRGAGFNERFNDLLHHELI